MPDPHDLTEDALYDRVAGAIDGMRLSHFGLKRLETEARKIRIAQLVARSGTTVRLDEISPVLAGAVLRRFTAALGRLRPLSRLVMFGILW